MGELFEGQFMDKIPYGFGRLIYLNSDKQVKCYVGFFENGYPVGKTKKFCMVKSTGKILLENQGVAKPEADCLLDDIEIIEENIISFGGPKLKVKKEEKDEEDKEDEKADEEANMEEEEKSNQQQIQEEEEEDPPLDNELIEQMKSIAIDDEEQEDVLEDDPNIVCLTPFNFDTVSKDDAKDVFVCIYNSNNHNQEIEKVTQAIQKTALYYKTKCPAPNLIIACFDRGTFDIPEVTSEQQEKIEKAMKGQPYFIFFPMNSEKGTRYNFERDFEAFRMFLQQKSQAVKDAMNN